MSRPRVVFMGTPAFAVPALGAVAAACDVVLVVTQPDRPAGRGRALSGSAVSTAACALGLELWKPDDLNAAGVRERLASLEPDLFAVVAFGAILSPELLAVPKLGAINLHGSVLPDYRGASPIQRALWDGRRESGVSTLFMDDGIDTGDVIAVARAPIADEDDAGTLAVRLAALGAPLLASSLLLALEGRAPRTPQDRAAGSYARKLRKQDGLIDWTLEANVVWCHARAVTPWPGAAAFLDGRRVIVTASSPLERIASLVPPGQVLEVSGAGVDVACASGALRLMKVIPEGRSEMTAADWARGARLESGTRFAFQKEQLT